MGQSGQGPEQYATATRACRALVGRVWLWHNYISVQGVTVIPGVELNLSAPSSSPFRHPLRGRMRSRRWR